MVLDVGLFAMPCNMQNLKSGFHMVKGFLNHLVDFLGALTPAPNQHNRPLGMKTGNLIASFGITVSDRQADRITCKNDLLFVLHHIGKANAYLFGELGDYAIAEPHNTIRFMQNNRSSQNKSGKSNWQTYKSPFGKNCMWPKAD